MKGGKKGRARGPVAKKRDGLSPSYSPSAKKRRGTVTWRLWWPRRKEAKEEEENFVVGYQGKVERPGKRMLPFLLSSLSSSFSRQTDL